MILLCRLISYDIIVVETISLENSCMLVWWMCSTGCDYVSLVSSHVLLGVVVYHWIVVVYYYG
jgi:hypothetical protein